MHNSLVRLVAQWRKDIGLTDFANSSADDYGMTAVKCRNNVEDVWRRPSILLSPIFFMDTI